MLSKDTFKKDEIITGVTSKTQAIASNVTQFSSSATGILQELKMDGKVMGFLNSDIERIQDEFITKTSHIV